RMRAHTAAQVETVLRRSFLRHRVHLDALRPLRHRGPASPARGIQHPYAEVRTSAFPVVLPAVGVATNRKQPRISSADISKSSTTVNISLFSAMCIPLTHKHLHRKPTRLSAPANPTFLLEDDTDEAQRAISPCTTRDQQYS